MDSYLLKDPQSYWIFIMSFKLLNLLLDDRHEKNVPVPYQTRLESKYIFNSKDKGNHSTCI